MKLAHFSVKRPVTVLMLVCIILTLGAVSLTKLQIDLLPEIELPIVTVRTSYSGVGPEEIENLVTRPLEQSLATIGNVSRISSTSREGVSSITIEFNFGQDMDFATLEVRERVDLAKRRLPSDVGNPSVMKINPNALPVIRAAITNGDGDLTGLQALIEDKIQHRLESIPGVASVNLAGGYTQEVQVRVSPERLAGYGLTLNQLAGLINSENLNVPGGTTHNGQRELLVRTIGEFNKIEDIRNLAILLPRGGNIYLRDLAQVELKNRERSSIAKIDGNLAMTISVQKESDANTVAVARKVNEELVKIKRDFPEISINTILDQSLFINGAIGNVLKNGFIGAVLAILVLFVFLRNIRTTFIIATSIPISIIATFTILYFSNITINLMTLGGLALGIGMLVDNAIVVLENIYRYREEGYSRVEAARLGADEVAMAVLASTLTTIAVFLPISFADGIASILFKELALTVTVSLISSLLVSLTLVPMLASKYLKGPGAEQENKVFKAVEELLKKIQGEYERILRIAISRKKTTILIANLIFLLAMGSLAFVGAEFFPAMDQGSITVTVNLPKGTGLSESEQVVTQVQNRFQAIPEIKYIHTSVNETGGNININLIDLKDRQRSSQQVTDEIRTLVQGVPGARISVTTNSSFFGGGGGGGAPILIQIKGRELAMLEQISDDFVGLIADVEGTREAKSTFDDGTPELRIMVDKDIASSYGLTSGQIAQTVRAALSGIVASTFKYEGSEIDIKLSGDGRYQDNYRNLETLMVTNSQGINIPLSQVAEFEIARGPVSISRADQVRIINVTSQIHGRDLRSVANDILKELERYPLPEGYSYTFGGDRQEMVEAFTDLALALILAILLVYMILASQFESLLNPLIIMFSVPLSIAGGALALFLTNRTLSVPAIIGVIMLAGIVVNNAIVLIDYINKLRERGLGLEEAVIKAGLTRMRPILMTTLTTVLGLMALALGIGEGAEIQAPMATVVIGGLLLSTLLTLVYIPVLYMVFNGRKSERVNEQISEIVN